ncbi:hypothetical protein EMEDMD4_160054 [Sinorhizobium medicae]|uniref:Uncharacterized protein n=1 Tax=Sinorhizobium medicae TaxID=110321 RepID=A0A508WXP9_9HYPH|nr:hypothetical protein EMEDMD4_160054 [Sinorhizobium medicae]
MSLAYEGLTSSKEVRLVLCASLIFPDQHPPEPLSLRALARPSLFAAQAIEYALQRVEVLRQQGYAAERLQ